MFKSAINTILIKPSFMCTVAILLSACQPQDVPDQQTGEHRVRGFYYYGHEVEVVTLCGQSQTYWLTGKLEQLQPLHDKALVLANQRGSNYQPIYVDLQVSLLDKPTAGVGAHYHGEYVLANINSFSDLAPEGCELKEALNL